MSNKVALNMAFNRAEKLAEGRCSILSSTSMTVALDTMLFAKLHIQELEKQIHTMKDTARKAGLVFDMDIIEFLAKELK